jgi:membrane dipeptidase
MSIIGEQLNSGHKNSPLGEGGFIIDAHLDLSMNAMEWNRDLRRPVKEINAREEGMTDKPDRSLATVSLPELRKGNIGLVVATQIARYVERGSVLPGWHSPEQAWAHTQGQMAWYKAMREEGEMVQVADWPSLERHVALWNDGKPNDKKPVGFILSLEGADSLITLKHLEKAFEYGLRAVGPAHYGPGRYAPGTTAEGGLTTDGKQLLKEMHLLHMILDVTHLTDEGFWEALQLFKGPVWASHNNCRALVNHQRQFSDEQLKALIERNAVIGLALDAWMMVPGWVRGKSTPREMNCNLEVMIDHLDHICQLAGNALHVGIGSDLDGAFGKEQCPYDLETIADLQKLPSMFSKRGYSPADIENMMHGNWLRFLRNAWK